MSNRNNIAKIIPVPIPPNYFFFYLYRMQFKLWIGQETHPLVTLDEHNWYVWFMVIILSIIVFRIIPYML